MKDDPPWAGSVGNDIIRVSYEEWVSLAKLEDTCPPWPSSGENCRIQLRLDQEVAKTTGFESADGRARKVPEHE
ncbi:hypothetical protein Y032_0176g551 [Ancylostoma ceylanicum]|uniref:Uncharacterized protein n=1 Tax=Ancylostoma ceylanicum TaxID=53326 RepID=A0A016SUL4_9BILA|nr:hypothetical protein Y032_0176g551 [Ancylostoma ceylanicum]